MERHCCRICGAISTFVLTLPDANGYDLYRCETCGTEHVVDPVNPAALAELYDTLFSDGRYDHHRLDFEQALKHRYPGGHYRKYLMRQIEKIVPGRDMIEIGGGTGAFGSWANARGWRYVEYDVSGIAIDYARKLGHEAHLIEPDSLPDLAPESADVIVMWDVIEHVWNVYDYLKLIQRALRPNGVFVFSTPNFQRNGYRKLVRKPSTNSPPIHLSFFTEGSLQKALQVAGFPEVVMYRRRLYRPGPNWKSMVYSLQVALGLKETKRLHGIARK